MITPDYLMPFIIIDLLLSLVLLLPISDSRQQQRFPIVTLILVGINTGIFIYTEYVLPRQLGDEAAFLFLRRQMLMPLAVVNGVGLPGWNMISAAFLHGSWSHLLGNMFFLMFFGRKVEDLLGPAKFLLLYFACIYLSHLASIIGEMALPVWQGAIPSLGASGAIMGVVGAYLFLYYEERIRTLPMIFGFIPFIFWWPRSAGVGLHPLHHPQGCAQRLAGRTISGAGQLLQFCELVCPSGRHPRRHAVHLLVPARQHAPSQSATGQTLSN